MFHFHKSDHLRQICLRAQRKLKRSSLPDLRAWFGSRVKTWDSAELYLICRNFDNGGTQSKHVSVPDSQTNVQVLLSKVNRYTDMKPHGKICEGSELSVFEEIRQRWSSSRLGGDALFCSSVFPSIVSIISSHCTFSLRLEVEMNFFC